MSKGTCEICEREEINVDFHHLIPKKCHSKKKFRKWFTMEEMKNRGIMTCKLCHKAIHKAETELTLGELYNTLEKLLEHTKIISHKIWAVKQKIK